MAQSHADTQALGHPSAAFTQVGWKSHCWYAGPNMVAQAEQGVGPRAQTIMNVPSAAKVWAGVGSKFSELGAQEVTYLKG
jgi:hypothetical protein